VSERSREVSEAEAEEVRAFAMRCPVPLPPGDHVLLGHGSGGKLTQALIRDLFIPALGADPELSRLGDAAVVPLPNGGRLAFTTDGFVVQPAFFPGSNIGELAVNGTVNDLAMMGAAPLALSAALILEEGLDLERLGGVVASMAEACRRAGVRLVTGDTKVVERGAADGLYVTTSGIGLVPDGVEVGPDRCRPGDAIVVSGPVGSHGVAVMSRRAGIEFEGDLRSDTTPLTGLVRAMLAAGDVRCLRDATRGGLASVLNELAEASAVSMTITESAVPVLPAVRAACEMLGLDPLYVANEGVAVAVVAPQDAEAVLAAARTHRDGREAALVGEVGDPPVAVRSRSGLGATRPLIMLAGDQLPRIC
jgi:hydrogenase expression/formation protein HypE